MTPGKILIRADASPQIGTGHVMRCLALAQAWQDIGGTAAYVCHRLPASVQHRLFTENIEVHPISVDRGGPKDVAETADWAAALGAEWVVVDGFDLSCEYLTRLSDAGLSILLIDDHANRTCYAQVRRIVNPNIFAGPGMYGAWDVEALAGSEFALLRREFRRPCCKKVLTSSSRNLVITLGGADPDNVTSLILRALDFVKVEGLSVTVLVGEANQHRGSIEKTATQSIYPVRLLQDVIDMPEILGSADAAISAPGGTSAELAALGIPMLLVTIAENHVHTAEEFAKQKLAFSAGWYHRMTSQQLGTCIQEFLDDYEERLRRAGAAARRIDGYGAERVIRNVAKRQVTAIA